MVQSPPRLARSPPSVGLGLSIASDMRAEPRLAPMLEATAVPGAEQYREIARTLREAARSCPLAGARREILHLAARFESRADHLDRRAGSTTATRLV